MYWVLGLQHVESHAVGGGVTREAKPFFLRTAEAHLADIISPLSVQCVVMSVLYISCIIVLGYQTEIMTKIIFL